MPGDLGGQMRSSVTLEMELLMVVATVWALGTELRLSARAADALNTTELSRQALILIN